MKSPDTMTCTPPKGSALPLIARPTAYILSRSVPSIILISSMTKVEHWRHRWRALPDAHTFAMSRSALSSPSPMPAKLWSVVPRQSTAAAPVEAVTKTLPLPVDRHRLISRVISARMVVVLPVPALPVKKREWPPIATEHTFSCPSVSSIARASAPSKPRPTPRGRCTASTGAARPVAPRPPPA